MFPELLDSIGLVTKNDPEVGEAMGRELARQRRNIELIASENIVSPTVMAAMGSILTNKYAEGLPGKRFYGGCVHVDEIETIAIERAKKLFGAEAANVQPHSGTQANMAVFFALLKPGDTVLGMSLAAGGHLSHGAPANMSGKYFKAVSYGVNDETHMIDYDEVRRLALEHKPRMIVAGASAYSRLIDYEKFAEIAQEVGAYLMTDMAHIAGLIAAKEIPSPVPYCDVVTTTTHKTLRGPRGGLILCKEKYIKDINKAVFPGIQGGPLEHDIAGKAVCLGEALKPEFKEYQHQIILNCRALAEGLKARGFDLVSGGTDNHLVLIDLRNYNITGKEFERRLDEVNITVNKNAIPNDPESPFVTSGVRVGTPSVTTRGFKEADMELIAEYMYLTVTDFEGNKEKIRAGVADLAKKYPLYE